MITVIPSFLKIFSLKKTFTYFFQYFRKSARKSKSKGRILEGLRVSLKAFKSTSIKSSMFVHMSNLKSIIGYICLQRFVMPESLIKLVTLYLFFSFIEIPGIWSIRNTAIYGI